MEIPFCCVTAVVNIILGDFFIDLFDAVCDGETELAREALLMGETLGEGAFGIVVKAEAVGLSHKTEKQFVAVKMLKSESHLRHNFVVFIVFSHCTIIKVMHKSSSYFSIHLIIYAFNFYFQVVHLFL